MQNHQSTTSSLPEHMLEQAAVWQMRLREHEVNSAKNRQIKAEISRWLLADPQHQQAYAEMMALWQALADPVQHLSQSSTAMASDSVPLPELVAPPNKEPARQWYRFAAAACLVFSLLGGLGWQQQWQLWLQSDYRTAIGQQQQLQLPDHSQLQLNTDSAIALSFSDNERRVRLLKGEAWFDVTSDPARPFVVETSMGTVTVTGTQFNVKSQPGQMVISLLEGSVSLASSLATSTNMHQHLVAGQQAQLTPAGIGNVELLDYTAVSAWRRGQWVFYQTPLQQVVAELNRYRPGTILILDEQLNQQQVSGVFSMQDPNKALQLISHTLQIQQTRLSDYLVLLH